MTCAVNEALEDGECEWLLAPGDPHPVDIINEDGNRPVVLVCEHAGRAVPDFLNNLGLPAPALDLHIAYDIGAEKVARQMAKLLNTPLVLQTYSRLVIDCNRPLDATDSIPSISDTIRIPGNDEISDREKQFRIDEIFRPFESALAKTLDDRSGDAVFAIHSFAKQLSGGDTRPWDIGLCCRKDENTPEILRAAVLQTEPNLRVGINQPYQIDDASDWTLPHHCEPRNISHCLIEVRNDLLTSDSGCEQMAKLLATGIEHVLEVAS